MKHIEVEIIGEAINASVVRLPDRRFPGVVVQGDSLAILTATSARAMAALDRRDVDEALEELRELAGLLESYQREYERAMIGEGLGLPYVKAP